MILLFITNIPKFVYSQNPFEPYFGIGLSAGVTNYVGDLNPTMNYKFSQFAWGGHFSLVFSKHLSARLTFLDGEVTADDLKSRDIVANARGLNFRSSITEVGGQVVYSLFGKQGGFLARANYSPYFFAGLAIFTFNPQANINGNWVDLQPLGTEGQQLHNSNYPAAYSLTAISIPFGIGFDYRLLTNIDVGVEFGYRKTFTSYLDDVSGNYPDEVLLRTNEGNLAADLSDRTFNHSARSGTPRGDGANDSYFYTNFHITYYFYWTIFGGRFSGSKHSGDCWAFPQ